MRILVDEMPKNAERCTFGWFNRPWNRWCCNFKDYVPEDCPKTCAYLAKGVVENELAGEDDGEKEAGEAAESDLA